MDVLICLGLFTPKVIGPPSLSRVFLGATTRVGLDLGDGTRTHGLELNDV